MRSDGGRRETAIGGGAENVEGEVQLSAEKSEVEEALQRHTDEVEMQQWRWKSLWSSKVSCHLDYLVNLTQVQWWLRKLKEWGRRRD